MKLWERFKNSEAGNVLVVAVVSSTVLIGVTGLAVDYGLAVVQETKLKNATDLAALAGVQELPYTSSAKGRMEEFLATNYEHAADCTVEVDSKSDSCWIIAEHAVPTHFMRIFGRNDLTIHARSKAELQNIEGVQGCVGVVPFVIANPNKNSNPNDDLTAANHGKPYLLKYSSDNIMLNDWYFGRQIVAPDAIHVETTTVKDGGWRSVLALDPNLIDPISEENSADYFRTNFAEGWDGRMKIGDILDSNPGVMTSGTTQGRDDRLDGNTTTWEEFDPNLDPENSRLIVVPVVSIGKYDILGNWIQASDEDIANGNYDWQHSRVDGFAAFFLLSEDEQKALPGGNNVDRKWVVGRFVYGVNIGGKILSPSDSTGPDFGMRQGRLVPF